MHPVLTCALEPPSLLVLVRLRDVLGATAAGLLAPRDAGKGRAGVAQGIPRRFKGVLRRGSERREQRSEKKRTKERQVVMSSSRYVIPH